MSSTGRRAAVWVTLGTGGLLALSGAMLLLIGIFASTLWLIARLHQYRVAMFGLLVVNWVLSLWSHSGWFNVILPEPLPPTSAKDGLRRSEVASSTLTRRSLAQTG